MAGGVRVGTGYIDIRLGDLKKFWGQLKKEVEATGRGVGDQLGRRIRDGFKIDPKAFVQIGTALRKQAIEGGDKFTKELRARFLRAGKEGADAVISEFKPELRRLIGESAIDGKDEFLARLEANRLGKDASRQLAEAFGAGLGLIMPRDAEAAGAKTGNAFTRGIRQAAGKAGSAFTGFGKAVDKVGQRVGLLGFQISNLGYTATAALSAPLTLLTGAAAGLGIKTAAAVEDAQVAFETLLGNDKKAKEFLRTLRDFANASPVFDIENVVMFTRKMLGAGIAVKDMIPALNALSSLAAAYALDQDQISRALLGFTQSLLKGKVQQEELNQVSENGIPIFDLLAQSMGKTKQQIQEMLKKGEITPEQLVSQIIKIGNSGKYLAGLEKRSKTLTGVWNQFKETLSSRLADALEPHLPKIKRFLTNLGQALDTFLKNSGPLFDKIFSKLDDFGKKLKEIADQYDRMNPKQKDFIDRLILIGAAAGPAIIAVGAFATAVGGVISALGFLTGPVGLTILALVGVGAAAYYAYQKSEEFRNIVKSLGDIAKDIGDKISKAWREKVLPAFREVAKVWNDELKPALKELYGEVKESLGPAIRELGGIVGEILVIALIFLATVITEFVVPALKILSTLIKEHPTEFKLLAWALFFVAAAFILVATIILGLFLVAIGLVILVVGQMIAIFILLVLAIAEAIVWIKKIADWWRHWTNPFADDVDRVRRKIREIPAEFAKLMPAIVGALGDLPSTLGELGRAAVQGLINGVLNRLPGVRAAGLALAFAFRAAVGSAFRTGSPSRVMIDVGKDVVAGFLIGLESMPSNVAVSPLASFAQGDVTLNQPIQPLSSADMRSALDGVGIYLDDKLVGRVQGRRAGLYGRAEY